MAVKITFMLSATAGQYDHVVSNLRRMVGIELKEDRDKKGDIVCVATVSDDHAERAAQICGAMCSVKSVDTVKIFVMTEPEPDPVPISTRERLKPLVPMITSAVVTFIIVFTVVDELVKNWTVWDIIKLAAMPALATFLTQLGMQSEWWKTGQTVIGRFKRDSK